MCSLKVCIPTAKQFGKHHDEEHAGSLYRCPFQVTERYSQRCCLGHILHPLVVSSGHVTICCEHEREEQHAGGQFLAPLFLRGSMRLSPAVFQHLKVGAFAEVDLKVCFLLCLISSGVLAFWIFGYYIAYHATHQLTGRMPKISRAWQTESQSFFVQPSRLGRCGCRPGTLVLLLFLCDDGRHHQ